MKEIKITAVCLLILTALLFTSCKSQYTYKMIYVVMYPNEMDTITAISQGYPIKQGTNRGSNYVEAWNGTGSIHTTAPIKVISYVKYK